MNAIKNENRKIELCSFLNGHYIASLATIGQNSPDIATIFYVFDGEFLYFKSRTSSIHSLNAQKLNNAALSVYVHDSNYSAKYGVQMRGHVSQIADTEIMRRAVSLYSAKFEGSGDKLPSIEELCSPEIKSTFYRFEIKEFKIIDEDRDINRTMLAYEQY